MSYSIEDALVAFIPDAVGVTAYHRVPPVRPGEFATVERTGGRASVGIDRPSVAIQVWAASRERAEEVALDLRDMLVLRAAELIPEVRSVQVTGPYDFPGQETDQNRYQLHVELVTEP